MIITKEQPATKDLHGNFRIGCSLTVQEALSGTPAPSPSVDISAKTSGVTTNINTSQSKPRSQSSSTVSNVDTKTVYDSVYCAKDSTNTVAVGCRCNDVHVCADGSTCKASICVNDDDEFCKRPQNIGGPGCPCSLSGQCRSTQFTCSEFEDIGSICVEIVASEEPTQSNAIPLHNQAFLFTTLLNYLVYHVIRPSPQ